MKNHNILLEISMRDSVFLLTRKMQLYSILWIYLGFYLITDKHGTVFLLTE